MQRIDGFYLFQLGQDLKHLREIRPKFTDDQTSATSRGEAANRLRFCYRVIRQLLSESVFDMSFARVAGETLLTAIDDLMSNCEELGDPDDALTWEEYSYVSSTHEEFESVLKASLGAMGLFLVRQKNAMHTLALVEAGEFAFPPDLSRKVPEAIPDVRDAMACIAFERPTAAAFHLHRANEVVLRSYWSSLKPDTLLPEKATMGKIVYLLEENKLGREEIRSSLRDLVSLHRNPIIHPEQRLDDVEQAINLYGAVRSIMGFMLEDIDEPIERELGTTENIA